MCLYKEHNKVVCVFKKALKEFYLNLSLSRDSRADINVVQFGSFGLQIKIELFKSEDISSDALRILEI